MKRILLASAALACLSAPAFAYTVQSGCAVPPTAIAGPSLTATNAATLSAAIASAPSGGTITLASGNYGDVNLAGLANTGWLKIVAGSGQTPVFTTLNVVHDSNLIFDGVTVQSLDQTGDRNFAPLVNVSDGGSAATTHDIVFANMAVSSLPALTGMTQAQLTSELRVAGFYIVGTAGSGTNGEPYTTCVSTANNHVQNVRNGIIEAANNSLVTNNEVDHYAEDGIAFAANNLTITRDNVHDVFNMGENGATTLPGSSGTNGGASGIEGWSGPLASGVAYNQFSNIVIDGNTFFRQLDPALPFPAFPISAATPAGGPQGIVAWIAGDWWNVTVTNNVVVTQGTCNGIYFPSLHNSLIANNTVAEESSMAGGGCPDVQIQAGENASSNVQMVANIAPEIWQWAGATINNNAATCNYDIEPFCAPINLNGNRKNAGDKATLNNAAHSSFQVPQAQFANFVPWSETTLSLPRVPDLHLSPLSWMVSSCDNYPATANSLACNSTSFFGRSVPGISPALDIEGNPRFGDGVTLCTIPVPGAYSFPIPCGSGSGTGPVPLPPPPPDAPAPISPLR